MNKYLARILSLLLAVMIVAVPLACAEEPYTITMYNTIGGPKFGNDQLQHQWLLDNLNLDVQGEWPGGTDISMRLNNMIASNEMPDVVVVDDLSQRALLQEFIDAGMVQPLDDYLSMLPDYQKFVTSGVLDYWRNEADGKLYMLPGFVVDPNSESYMDLMGDPRAFGIRDDMFALTGWDKAPETFDEFYQFLVDAKNAAEASDDPLYDNFVPFGMYWPYFPTWAVNFGANPCQWELDEENQYLVPLYLQDGWREAAVYFAKLYREGLLEPEQLTMEFGDIVEKAKQASYGVFSASIAMFNDNIKGALANAGHDFYYTAVRFPREVAGEYTGWYHKNSLGGSIAIFSKDIQDMEKVMEYVNWQNTRVGNCITWWGAPDKEDSWFYLTEDGTDIVYNAAFMDGLAQGTKTTDYAAPYTYWIAGPGVNDSCQLYTNVIDSPGFDDFFNDMRKLGYEDAHFDAAFDAFNLAPKGEIYNSLWADIKYISDSYLGDIIMRSTSDEEANAMVDQMIEEMKAAGIEDLMRECYQVYKDANA